MFFTKIGRIVAFGAVIFGALRVAIALFIIFAIQADDVARATAEYLGRGTAAEAIDKGVYLLVFGILVGILTEISKSFSRAS